MLYQCNDLGRRILQKTGGGAQRGAARRGLMRLDAGQSRRAWPITNGFLAGPLIAFRRVGSSIFAPGWPIYPLVRASMLFQRRKNYSIHTIFLLLQTDFVA